MGDYLWKCEACDGWLDLRRGLDAEQPLAAAMECSCPSPDIQQRIRPLKAIELALLECERVLAQFSRMQRAKMNRKGRLMGGPSISSPRSVRTIARSR
jgi:hypothetical protein